MSLSLAFLPLSKAGLLFRQTLKLVDKNGDLVFLVVPHGHEVLKEKLGNLLKELETLFPGERELRHTNSCTPGYNFLALHYSYYNRYHELVRTPLLPVHSFLNVCYGRERVLQQEFTPMILGRQGS